MDADDQEVVQDEEEDKANEGASLDKVEEHGDEASVDETAKLTQGPGMCWEEPALSLTCVVALTSVLCCPE